MSLSTPITSSRLCETLRSGWTLDGARIFLIFDHKVQRYRLASRWQWFVSFDHLADASEAFEVLELCEVSTDSEIKRYCLGLQLEIKRQLRSRDHPLGASHAMTRVLGLLDACDRRYQGQRPVSCGSKHSVTVWRSGASQTAIGPSNFS